MDGGVEMNRYIAGARTDRYIVAPIADGWIVGCQDIGMARASIDG